MILRTGTLLVVLAASGTVGACTSGTAENVAVDEPAAVSARINDEIQTTLQSSEPWVRAEAVRLLAVAQVPSLESALLSAVNDSDPLVRASAMEQLLPSGNRTAQDALLAAMRSAELDERVRLFRLAIRQGTERFSAEAATFIVRERAWETRLAALVELRDSAILLDPAVRDQLLSDPRLEVADAAFAYLAEREPEVALERVLTELRSTDLTRRTATLRTARHLTHADLWPSMRAVATYGPVEQQFAARCVLGRLGDSSVEEALRSVILTGSDEDAGLALRAISSIRTERAQLQASRHIDDPRANVRRAALDVLLQRGVGAAELERFLADPDPTIGRLAMSAIIASDATRAAAIARRQLEGENQELRVLLSLHQTAQQQDISAVLAALQDVLIQLVESPQDDVASVALRLLRGVETAEDTLLRVAQAGDQSLYSGLERAMELPTENMRPVLLHALTHDLRMVRYAAALALLKLNS